MTDLARRSITIPLYLGLFALSPALLAVALPAALVFDLLRSSRLAATRGLSFLAWYLALEAAGIAAAGFLPVWRSLTRADADRYRRAHVALKCWWARNLLAGGRRLFGLRIRVVEEPGELTGPLLLFMRHASTADTILTTVLLTDRRGIDFRHVMKRELLWDPCLEIVGQRLPNCFVNRSGRRGEAEIRAVAGLARGLGPDEGVLIYPEGTRFTPEKRERALARLAERGGEPFDRARRLRYVLPPRPGGALALLDAAPNADVLFCAHTGLEDALDFRRFLEGGLVGRTVEIAWWRVPAREVPAGREARLRWMFDWWERIDEFVARRREGATGGPATPGPERPTSCVARSASPACPGPAGTRTSRSGRSPLVLLAAGLALLLPGGSTAGVRLERVAAGLAAPVQATAPVDDPADGRLFVVEQGGTVRIHDGPGLLPDPFLDLSSQVSAGGERGLLGLAFAPDHHTSGRFYLNYTRAGDGATVIARMRVGADPNRADPASLEPLLTIAQPFPNHNGGHLAFGPLDGLLYIGMGDGGSGGDPLNHAQNPATLLGAMLRIDVSGASGYAVPPSNPGFPAPEIWAIGLRNPYRFSFDRLTGDLFIGDVGQDAVEEIDFQPSGSPGGENYGWRCFEGSQPFDPSGCPPASALVFPVLEYRHGEFPGVLSVTGGYRYRGPVAELGGSYFYADFGGILFEAVETAPGSFAGAPVAVETDAGSLDLIAGFGEDADGDLYAVDLDGEVFRFAGRTADAGCPAAPLAGCLAPPERSVALLRDRDADGPGPGDKLAFKWLRGPAVDAADLPDPLAADAVRVCAYAGPGPSLVFSAVLPPGGTCGGSPCWKRARSGTVLYRDPQAATDGIKRLVLRPGEAGRSRVVVTGRGPFLPTAPLPLPAGAPMRAQVSGSPAGACFEADHPEAAWSRNRADLFRSRTP